MTTDPAHLPAGQEVIMVDVDWRQPFIEYIREQKVPSDKTSAEQLLVGDKLYRRGATSGVLMKCVPEKKGMTSWRVNTRASAATMHPHVRLSAMPSDELSTGPQLWAMSTNSSEGAKGASTSPSNNTSRPTS
jgi:hypothetical protein